MADGLSAPRGEVTSLRAGFTVRANLLRGVIDSEPHQHNQKGSAMPQKEPEGKEEGPRSFGTFLQQVADGEAESETSSRLHELMKLLQEQARALGTKVKGSLTLKLNFQVEQSAKHEIVNIAYDVTVKEPKRRTSPATYWLTRGGNLTPHNPAQQKLPLRDVSGGPGKQRDVGEGPAMREEG